MKKTLQQRINYAARIIRDRKPTSRRFDSCFEEGDGDEVVKALIKRKSLTENLPLYIAQSSIDKFKQ